MSGRSTLRSSLSPVAECEFNNAALSARHNNLPPLEVSRRRNNAVSSLYRTAMKKRDSAGIISIDTCNEDYSSLSNLIKKKSAASLNVSFSRENQTQRSNPISHYEHNMNHSLATRSSSAVQLATTQRPKPPVRARSSDNVHKTAGNGGKTITSNSRNCPEKKQTAKVQDALRTKPSKGNVDDGAVDDVHELLSDELLSALNDDIFDGEFSFDNKWSDNSNSANHSNCSGNGSPCQSYQTCCTVHSLPQTIPGPATVPNLNRGMGLPSSLERKKRAPELKSRNSRFQLKLDTLRLKVQNTHDAFGATNCGTGHKETMHTRYWLNSANLKTKMISEDVNRELKCVTRDSLYASSPGSRMLVSILNRVPSEQRLQRATQLRTSSEEKLRIQPAIGSIKSTQSDLLLSDFLQKNLDGRNIDSNFRQQLSMTIHDQDLRNYILRGRDNSRHLWIESERLEFDQT